MSNVPAQRNPAQDLVARVRGEQFMEQVKMALPEGMPAERFVRATVTALMQNPELPTQAHPDSILNALLRSAQDGLVPDGQEAALVVYNGKAQYLPMIGGYRKIAGEHGWALVTSVVKQGDQFEYELGLEPQLRHRPGSADRGQTIAAYCVALHTSGQKFVEVMTLAELEQIRAVSKKPTSGPWKDWTDRMYEKTVGRRTFKKLPLGNLDPRVLRLREAADTPPAEAERLIYGTVIEEPPANVDSTHTLPAGTGSDSSDEMATSEPEATQQAEPAVPLDPAAGSAPGIEEEPEPSTFQAPAGTDDDPVVFMAKAAARVVVPIGKWQGKTLAEVLADASGPQYLRYALREFNDATGTGPNADPQMRPGEFIQALYAFTRVYLPDEYQAALAAKEAA